MLQNQTPEQREIVKRWFSKALSIKTPAFRRLYVFCFIAFIIALSWILDYVCLAVARALVREMIEVRSVIALIALHTFNFLFVGIATTVSLLLAVIAGAPVTWPIVWLVVIISEASKLVAAGLTLFGVFCAVWFSPVWIRVLIVVAAMPSVMLVLMSVIALLLTPFRNRLHKFITSVLDRIALREKAAIAVLFALSFATLIVVAALLTAVPAITRGAIERTFRHGCKPRQAGSFGNETGSSVSPAPSIPLSVNPTTVIGLFIFLGMTC